MELIDKAVIVEEIEKYKVRAQPSYYGCGRLSVCEDLINFINTLEVKEVDLKHEIEKVEKMQRNFEIKNDTIIEFCAKHFFELGIKAQKGE